MQYVQIPGTTFVRDVNSMGLVNKDLSALEDYKMKRRMLATQKEEINTIKSEIENIKNDMLDIKQLMLKLLNKGSNG